MQTATDTYQPLTLSQQYVNFLAFCDTVDEAIQAQDGTARNYRQEVVHLMRSLCARPAYAELVQTRFKRPDLELPLPNPTLDRIVRLLNRLPRRPA